MSDANHCMSVSLLVYSQHSRQCDLLTVLEAKEVRTTLHGACDPLYEHQQHWRYIFLNGAPFHSVKVDKQRSCLWVIGWPQTLSQTAPPRRGIVQRDCSHADALRFPNRGVRNTEGHSACACRLRPDRRRWSPSARGSPIAMFL